MLYVVYHATMLFVVVISVFLIYCDAQNITTADYNRSDLDLILMGFNFTNGRLSGGYINGSRNCHRLSRVLPFDDGTSSSVLDYCIEPYQPLPNSKWIINSWLQENCSQSILNFTCKLTAECRYTDGIPRLTLMEVDIDEVQEINAIPSDIGIAVEADFLKESLDPDPAGIQLREIGECVGIGFDNTTPSLLISNNSLVDLPEFVKDMCMWIQSNCYQSIGVDFTCKLSVSCNSSFELIEVERWFFCREEITNGNQKWCKTRVGEKAFPCENPCLDTNGKVISRRCILEQGVPKWSPLEYVCTNATVSNTTIALSLIRDNVTLSGLEDVSDLISRETSSLTDFDVDIVAHILSISANQNKAKEYKAAFFQIVNNLHDVNRSVLKSAREFGSTEKILKSIDKFLVALSVEQEDNLTLPNIAFEIVHPKPSNQDDAYNLTLQDVSAKIPNDILNTSILTIFKSDALFLEGNVASDVVDLKVLGVNGTLKDPVSIYLKCNPSYGLNKVVCSFWKYNEADIENWSTEGIETVRINDNLVECRSNHLTAFALLGVSDMIISKFSPANQLALRVITPILCVFSLVGLIIVFFTCFGLKEWYKKRINTVQLSCAITLEIIMLFLNDVVKINDGLDCQIFGAFMHYFVLVKFVLMLLIAKTQYDNFVTVLTSRNKSRKTLFNALITFIIPMVVVALSVGLFTENYNSGNQEFCYPKDNAFRYFVIIPVALILFANITIFLLVMLKISRSITREAKQKSLQTKLAVMLFFMLGITWIFSVLAQVFQTQFLQLVFVYVFSILSALQGFVIFLFTVIMDSDAKAFWTQYCKRVYALLDKKSANTTDTWYLHGNKYKVSTRKYISEKKNVKK